MERRSRTEILSLILQSADNGATLTILMYETYLSHEALRGYLSSLLREGLLEYLHGEMKFKTTKAGREYLSSWTGTSCSHQCEKCGILYRCDCSRCHNPFQHGLCLRCAKVISCETIADAMEMAGLSLHELAR